MLDFTWFLYGCHGALSGFSVLPFGCQHVGNQTDTMVGNFSMLLWVVNARMLLCECCGIVSWFWHVAIKLFKCCGWLLWSSRFVLVGYQDMLVVVRVLWVVARVLLCECYSIVRQFQHVSMQLLWCCGWLLECCYENTVVF